MKIRDLLQEADEYLSRSGDDKAPANEDKIVLLLDNGARLIQHFQDCTGNFRVDVSFRNRRFVAVKKDPFFTVPAKLPNRPLNF